MATSTGSLAQATEQSDIIPSFEVLVSHLLAAKRSLSCVEHVSHANDLVTNTRHALEIHTALSARTAFIHTNCVAQTRALEQIREYLQNISQDTGSEFSSIIKSLDVADGQLSNIIDQLRDTKVESTLRPADEQEKFLIDFVDETGPQGLLDTIKETINTSGRSKSDYEQALAAFDEEVDEITALLAAPSKASSSASLSDDVSPVPQLLHALEEAAQEMASNLESLVKHFDLCVSAIKHTEGGDAAATNLMANIPEDEGLRLSQMEGATEPISDEERREMMEVIAKDATEVDEVVVDIKERAAEMEVLWETVAEHGATLDQNYTRASTALKMLDQTGSKLPSYLAQSQVYLYRWEEERLRMEEHLTGLGDLRDFYGGFLQAYDALIIEVGRRKDTDRRIRDVLQKALLEVGHMLEDERLDRDSFREAQGEFLPVDIWPGLSAEPPKYEMNIQDGDSEVLPDISASTIRKALRRKTDMGKTSSLGASQS